MPNVSIFQCTNNVNIKIFSGSNNKTIKNLRHNIIYLYLHL